MTGSEAGFELRSEKTTSTTEVKIETEQQNIPADQWRRKWGGENFHKRETRFAGKIFRAWMADSLAEPPRAIERAWLRGAIIIVRKSFRSAHAPGVMVPYGCY